MPQFRCGSTLRNTPSRSLFSAARSACPSANALVPRGAFRPAPFHTRVLARSPEFLRSDLRGASGAHFSNGVGQARDYAPVSAAREQKGLGLLGIARRYATGEGKRLGRPLPPSIPAAECAQPERRQCANAGRRALRMLPRRCEETTPPKRSRATTRLRHTCPLWPQETRVRGFRLLADIRFSAEAG